MFAKHFEYLAFVLLIYILNACLNVCWNIQPFKQIVVFHWHELDIHLYVVIKQLSIDMFMRSTLT